MTAAKPISTLKTVFAETFGISPDTDIESLQYRSIPQWDSVAHMRLVNSLETTFDVMLSTEQVLGMNSFQRAREILSEHGLQFDA